MTTNLLRLLPCRLPLCLPCCRYGAQACRLPFALYIRTRAGGRGRAVLPPAAAAAACRGGLRSCSLPLLLAFSSIRHKYGHIGNGQGRRKRTPFEHMGIPVYANISLRCLIAKFFIFYFFYFLFGGGMESNP